MMRRKRPAHSYFSIFSLKFVGIRAQDVTVAYYNIRQVCVNHFYVESYEYPIYVFIEDNLVVIVFFLSPLYSCSP